MSIQKAKNYSYGVHVPDMKHTTSNLAIEYMPEPKTAYLCMSQHIGAPASPCVNVGDVVKKGQLVGSANGAVSANVYSSISGTVKQIARLENGLGQNLEYVIVENDFSGEEIFFPPIEDTTPKSLVERIRLAGIVGLGGAGFPTAIKLSPKNQLDTLIVNGAECEPYLTCDDRLMVERTEDIIKGAKLLAKALNIEKIVIGIEANKPKAIELFKNIDGITLVVLKKQYPMGSEKHLIYCTTGRKVAPGKMPFDVGVCVQNIKTIIACYEAIELNKPLTQTVLTVSGSGVNIPKNIKAYIGTPFEEIIDFCGGIKEQTVKLVAGGPMMGKSIVGLNHYLRKADSGILALLDGETDLREPSNCINCGTCAKNCPMRLMPMYIERCALVADYEGAEKYGAMNCLECGSCAYNCPAKRPLVQNISLSKIKIKEMKTNGR